MAKNFSDGTNEDFDGYEAIELFLKVADIRDDIFKYEEYMKVAQIYCNGLGNVTPDGHKAIEYFLKAIDTSKDSLRDAENLPWAMRENRKAIHCSIFSMIAEIYLDGCGELQPDGYEAIKYLLRGVDESKPDLSEDDEEHVAFDKILDGVHALAFKSVAEIYRDGLAGVQPDAVAAAKFFLMADELTADD